MLRKFVEGAREILAFPASFQPHAQYSSQERGMEGKFREMTLTLQCKIPEADSKYFIRMK